MNLNSDYCIKFKLFQAYKGSNCDLVICKQFIREPCYNLASKMAAKEARFNCVFYALIYLRFLCVKGVRALRDYFGPLQSQKMKVAFHQVHLIGLLAQV